VFFFYLLIELGLVEEVIKRDEKGYI